MPTLHSAPETPTRRRACTALLAAALAVVAAAGVGALSACAEFAGPRTLSISEAELTRRINERFPFERRFFELLDVRLESPTLRLLPQANRVATELTLTVTDRLFGRSVRGNVAFDGALRWDDAEAAVRLHAVRVTQLRFDRVPPGLQASVDRLGGALAAQALDGLVLHRFKPEQVERARQLGLRPGAIDVTAGGIEIKLVKAAT